METVALFILGSVFVYMGYSLNTKKINNKEQAKGFKEAFWMKLSNFLFAMGISMLAFFIVLLIKPIDFSIIVTNGNDIRFKDLFMVWAYAFIFVAIAGLIFNINIVKSVLDFHNNISAEGKDEK